MDTAPRDTGIDIIGQMTWGMHGCLFYETQQDLLDLLTPYFQAGLQNHESCLYVAAKPANAEEARRSLHAALPAFDRYLADGQMEIIPFSEWLFDGGHFDFQKALNGFRDKRDHALARGYTGLRFVGNPYPVPREHWNSFMEFERAVDELLRDSQIVGVCTYALHRSSADDVLDIVRQHEITLARRNGAWDELAGSALRRAHAELERRVVERTALLAAANEQLSREVVERKQAEDKLRFQAQLLASVRDAILAVDAQNVITAWNPGAEALYGWTADEVIGRTVASVLQTEFDGTTREAVQQAISRMNDYRGEVRHRRKDGSWIPIETKVQALRDAGGRVIGRVAVNREIADRKKAELARSHLAATIESSDDAIYSQTLDGIILSWNRGAQELYGYSADEAVGQSIKFLIPAERFDELPDLLGRLSRGEHIQHYETVRLKKDGAQIDVSITLSPIRDAHGRLVAGSAIARDITERKQAEERLRREAARTDALLRVARALNAELNLDKVIQTVSDETCRVMNVPMAGVSLFDQLQGVFRFAGGSGSSPGLLAELHPFPRAKYDKLRPNGEQIVIIPDVRALSELSNPHFSETMNIRTTVIVTLLLDRGPIGTLAVATVGQIRTFDEHELKLLQGLADQSALAIENARLFQSVSEQRERLRVLSARLVEAQEVERHLIARQLHDEIGQALTAVKLNLQTLQRAVGEPASRQLDDSIAIVEETLQRARNLSLELRPSMLDDLGLAAALRWYVDRQAQRAGLQARVTAHLPDGRQPPEVETACFRVAQEALTNVLRHAQAQHVEVELRHDGAALELVIRDDGVGFDLGAAQAQALRGESLGLLGMRERALLVGGDVKIESSLSHGTVVRARFPLDIGLAVERRGAARHS